MYLCLSSGMIIINGKTFYEEPGSCGTCPFLFIPCKDAPGFLPSGGGQSKYHCTMFNEMHASWRSVPPRCRRIFKKAFGFPEGSVLVICSK